MTLKDWVKSNFAITRPTLLASEAARRYLADSGRVIDQAAINRTIVRLHDLGLLAGAPNHPMTRSRLVPKP